MRATWGEGISQNPPALEEFFESKVHPPPARHAIVPRPALVDRLVAAKDVPIASVVAPAGYGKTTLLAEWAHREPTRVAWLSVDRHDNDLGVLLPYAAAALDRLEPVDPELLRPSTRRRSVVATAARIAAAMSSMQRPAVLVLDHVELLDDDECVDTIAELALHLDAGSRLALASRGEPPVPISSLRARGDVIEIGVDELAMSFGEARALLEGAGVQVADADVAQLIERTEGWPVGLYLAALALKAGGTQHNAGIPFRGDDRLVADYLRSEILSHLSATEVEFLTRTSVLERMTGALCDAVLDTTGSDELLDTLTRSNLLLVALDRQGRWYRYHHLFRDLLRAELERREPELLPILNLRAARWCESHHLPERAIRHAQVAGDAEMVNWLLLVHGTGAFASGRGTSVRRWLHWFDDQGLVPRYPAVAVLGALAFSSIGLASEAEYWADAAENPAVDATFEDGTTVAMRASPSRVLPDGSTLESWRAILRALRANNGLAAVRRDAEVALDGLSGDSGYRGVAIGFLGLCDLLEDDIESADRNFVHCGEIALKTGRRPLAVIALSERALIYCRRNEWDDAEALAQQALETVTEWDLDDYAECALAHVSAARVALHQTDGSVAGAHLTQAARLRPQLTNSRPIISAQTLVEMARVYAALTDTAGAREVLRQARDILRQRPDLGSLPIQVDELIAKLDTMSTSTLSASALTAAELRLLPFLPTHLTYPQIAARLYVSHNTVKTHVISVYQKLGVSSRADAVQKLQEVGLLDS